MSERLSDYLLGELPPDERAAFEAELERDAALRAEVDRLAPVVTRLAAMEPAAWETPPLPALPALPAESEARQERTPRRGRGWWQRSLALRPLPAAALAAVLIALGVAAGVLLGDREDEGAIADGRTVVLAPVEGGAGAGEGTATLAGDGDRAAVSLRGLPPSEPGQFYELWLLNSVDDMVALGSFSVPASGALDVTVPLPADAGRFGVLDLSLEPDDGDPAHSTISVLRAPLKSS